ncbi:MAG: signal recognition particle-docking protein FtsY [Deltaproteobacteria bacterium]|nr:signal recognition particle-docking protein FtsY [Deltaproteobacteria bacterium]
MGFFSKLKKIWKGQDKEPARVEPTPEPSLKLPEVEPGPVPAEMLSKSETGPIDSEQTPIEPQLSSDGGVDTDKGPAWKRELLTALHKAEPKLSVWLDLILDGIPARGEELRERLRFLFVSLEAPVQEAEDFVTRFDAWLEDMDYERVEEFRSELQYRLALALDLEDEEDERDRLFVKLSDGLAKTKEQLSRRIDQLLKLSGRYDDTFWEELEEILIMADVGYSATAKLLEQLRSRVRKEGLVETDGFKELLRDELVTIFKEPRRRPVPLAPEVVMMVGVNGVGKTTTIAKLAHRAQMQGQKVLVAAGDTFRAAAIEQLGIWAKRTGAGFFAKEHGSDPAAVAYEGLEKAMAEGYDKLFVDTAGRIHTKVDLMEELKKIKRVVAKKHPGAPHRVTLVLDATTGQNALSQVEFFAKAVDIDDIVMTKLDGTAKGGIIVAIALEHGLPISFIGLGEKMEDLRPFNAEDFARALLGQ